MEEGDLVKLIFESPDPENVSSERMWVLVQRRKNNEFYGVLDNQPYGIEGLNLGDEIRFNDFHIVSVEKHRLDETSDEGRYFARCHVDQRILQDDVEIARLERRKPKWVWWWKRKQQMFPDTGWHIFAEEDPSGSKIETQYVAIGVVLNKNDGFLNLLKSPTGTKLRRDGDVFWVDN